ncbi:MAG: amidohydrolase family protein [Calditrichaeota bacterium]|nr:amidohydrolase family protein [Calditrichota bacterium]
MIRTISLILLITVFPLFAQSAKTVFTGAHIIPVSGDEIDNGVLLIENGKILAVGEAGDVAIPADAKKIDVKGKVIMPGLVDTHSHLGLDWGFDSDSPTHPDLRILDAINPYQDNLNRARAGGITTLNIMPGSGHLLSGQTVYLKPKQVNTVNEMLFCNDVQDGICGGIKMANGTNSMRDKPFPGTRGKSAAIVREMYYKALEYKKKIEEAGDDESKLPPRDIGMDALVQVLNGGRIVHHHTHRADDILTVLRLQKEFGFKVVLHHVSEGWKVAKEIAEAKVPCSVIVIDSPGGKLEAVGLRFDTAKILADAGVQIAFHTDDWITDSRVFLRSAAFGVRAGLSRKIALEAMTINGAKMLELDDRVGSLEEGKDADFIVLSGDPLSVYTHIEQTWIDGKKEFDRANDEDYKYAVGGFKVYRGYNHIQCFDGGDH